MKTIVVNLFGAPGSGKSTGAAYVFAKLKLHDVNAELITEFAKDKVWEDNMTAIKNQSYMFGKQSYRMSRCAGKVDVIVTDSPLPLSILYNEDPNLKEEFYQSVMSVFNSYQNLNFLLLRNKPYNPVGRLQTEAESNKLHDTLEKMMHERNINHLCSTGDMMGYEFIVKSVLNELKSKEQPKKKELTAAQAIRYKKIMCSSYNGCAGCPLYEFENSCSQICEEDPQSIVDEVSKWAIEFGYVTEDMVDIKW